MIAVFTGTGLQMLLALIDTKASHTDALGWSRAEDELVREQPRLSRRRLRKELASSRDPNTERSLAYVDVVLVSWTLLFAASKATP